MMEYRESHIHTHLKTNLYIVFIGILFGIFSGISIFLLESSKIESDKNKVREVFMQTSREPTPTPTPSDYCLDVPVLTYHHIQPLEDAEPKNQTAQTVSPGNFDFQMRWLKDKGYTFISLEDLVDHLQKRTPFEEKVIAITLDDGYRDAYTYAYPIAQKHDVVLNIGVITGLLGNPEHLTASQVIEMNSSPLIHFHNHSWSHRNLQGGDKVMIEKQIMTAQNQLNDLIGSQSAILYYPYGVFGDTAQTVLSENSFDAAFELSLKRESTKHCLSKIYELPRLRVGNAGPGVHDL